MVRRKRANPKKTKRARSNRPTRAAAAARAVAPNQEIGEVRCGRWKPLPVPKEQL